MNKEQLMGLGVTTEAFVLEVLTHYNLLCEQGLQLLQMAFKRCQTRQQVSGRTVILEFERLTADLQLSDRRPLDETTIQPLAYDIRTSHLKSKLGKETVARIVGLPLGVEPKAMKVLSTQVPSAAIERVLVRMFNGDKFKSRDICPLIDGILDDYLESWPDELAYHIACRLVSAHKNFLVKTGTTYHYA